MHHRSNVLVIIVFTIHTPDREAQDCHSNSVRYDMVLSSTSGHPNLDLIRSPTTLQRRQKIFQELE
eukprot:scaffold1391_cov84-Skeletonema_dohrnii-CCMP3373.AAC.2